jgi:hypothetical protein
MCERGVRMKTTLPMNKELDFNLQGTAKRLDKLHNIIEKYDSQLVDYYDNHFIVNKTSTSFEQDLVGQELEKLADYLLFADNKEQRQKPKEEQDEVCILNKSQIERNAKKETLTDDLTHYEHIAKDSTKHSFYSDDKRYKNKMNIKEDKPKKRKVKKKNYETKSITKADLEKFPVLKQTNDLLEKLKEEIKNGIDTNGNKLNEEQIRKKRWLSIELKKDQVAYKDAMSKHVNAKSVIRQSLQGKLDVNFADLEAIDFLFHEYSNLKQYCYDDINSDLKHVLMDFEQLVDSTPLSEILKEVLVLKIDGLSHSEINHHLSDKYQIQFGKQHISTMVRNIIPKKIIDNYRKQREDWFYTEIVKGKYKKCNRCGEIKLASDNYFSKDKKGIFGYKSICKKCHSTK